MSKGEICMRAAITGASSGIGREMAIILSKQGHNLILISRDKAELSKLNKELGGRHRIIAKDLTANPESISKEIGNIDVLINNAGFGSYGRFIETDLQKELGMISLNIAALTTLSKLAARQMVKRKKGMIMNVASTAAFQPGPMMAVYYATKAYVLSFSEALAEELKGTGVSVTTLCPGPTRTKFIQAAHAERNRLFSHLPSKGAEEVAKIGIEGMLARKRIVIVGKRNKVHVFMLRFLPRSFVTWLVLKLQAKGL